MMLGAFFALMQAISAQVTVPSSVNTTFSTTYPGAQAVNWTLDNGNYRGEFTGTDNMRTSVTYNGTGQLMQTEIDIHDIDLPPTARQSLNGTQVNRYTRITDAKGVVTYSTTIDNKRTVYDAQGNLVSMPKQGGN